MNYLSPEIEAMLKSKTSKNSLAKKQVSCGIFQDYDIEENIEESEANA